MKNPLRLRLILCILTVTAVWFTGQMAAATTLPPVAYLPLIQKTTPGPTLGGCMVLPWDNIWNTPVDTLPADLAHTQTYLQSMKTNSTDYVHADFGSGLYNNAPIGIPFVVVPGSQPFVPIQFNPYGSQSDPGPYPFPANAPIEGAPDPNGDRHALVLDQGNCKLYELYRAFPQANGSWNAASGAVYDLTANAPLRPAGWTSADAAGLPMLPGLARFDEVASGEIRHALRFTSIDTQSAYVWPARHTACHTCAASYPPMGQRFRLKASFDISGFGPQSQVILKAMKKYGLILADNGTSWYISGAPDPGWDNDDLHQLQQLHGDSFEAVDATTLQVDANSGQARQP